MKKLFLLLAIAGFIACNTLIGGSDQVDGSGNYAVRGIYKTVDANRRYYVNFAIENVSGGDLYLDSIVIFYGDEDENKHVVIDDLHWARIYPRETRFYSKRLPDNSNTIRYKIYQK